MNEVDPSSFEFGQLGCQSKIVNIMANSVDPDEMACYKPSHLDLHCLHKILFLSAELNGLTQTYMIMAAFCITFPIVFQLFSFFLFQRKAMGNHVLQQRNVLSQIQFAMGVSVHVFQPCISKE